MDEWIKKVWCIYTIEYYILSYKKNDILAFVATWMDLGSTILSETKKKKDKYYMISLIYGIWKKTQAKKWKKKS